MPSTASPQSPNQHRDRAINRDPPFSEESPSPWEPLKGENTSTAKKGQRRLDQLLPRISGCGRNEGWLRTGGKLNLAAKRDSPTDSG